MKKLMKSVLACLLAFAMVLTVMPVNSYAAAKKSVVVTNQKQLEKALKNGATNIVIKTNKNVKITIPATKKAAKASISIQAKNATITNKASVKSIVIKDAKTFVESGKNNDIKITDSKLSLTVAKGSKGADIKVAKKDAEIKVVAKGDVASVTVAKTADVTLTVNKTATVASVNVAAKGASVDLNAKGTVSDVKVSEKAADTKLNINASGKVENVQIDAKADVAVAGSTTEAVKVTVNAKDTTIKAETAVETTLNADAKVDLSKGAEGSKVTTAENVKVDVANNTEDKVIVTDSTGKETSVDAGKTETTKDESKEDDEKKDDQSSGGSSGGSSGTVTPTPTPSEPKNPEIVGATKTSIIIKAVAGQVYACVESGKKVGEADFKWTDEDIDELGNIEISGLDSTKKYEIYTKNQTSDPIKADQIVDLSNQKETVVLFDNSPTTLSGEGIWDDNNEQLIISAPIDFEFCVYGKASEAWDWEVGMDSNQPGIRFNGFPDDIKFEITPEFTGERNGSFKFDYQVGTWNDKRFSPIAKREYTVNYKISEEDWKQFKKNSIPKLKNISVTAANMISLRFDVLVPEKISKDVVSVKDGSGNLVAIESITRDTQNDYRYNITLGQNLTDGAYNVEITVYNTLCTESFTYNDSVWTPMNTVRTVVENQLKKTYTPQGASLSSCEETFKKELNKAFSGSNINTEELGVYVGVYGDWIRYEGGKLFCSIEVDILSGSAKYELEQEDVEFKLSQKPEIFGATKTSIVVNPIVGLEYTYVKSGEKISENAKWYGYDDYDDHDHIIFDKLDTTSYDVYYRMAESPKSISQATVVDLTQKQETFAVVSDSNEEYAENAYYNWEKGRLVVDVFIEPDVVVYDQNGFVDEYDYSIDDKDSMSVVYQGAEADGYGIMISFAVADTCQVNKDYTFGFDFNVMAGEDSGVTIGSKNYDVTFKIPKDEWDKKNENSDAKLVDTWVNDADEIVLRFDNTVPSNISPSDVEITRDAKKLAIASIQKGENGFPGYVIKLVSPLADASYTGSINVNNTNYPINFTYKTSDWSIAKSILDSALSKLTQIHTEVANSFSESYYVDAIQKELFDFVKRTVEENKYDTFVSHGAGVSTLDISVENGKIKVSTVVSVYCGQSRAKTECVVPYELCATPNVVAATKNSIIVRGVKGLQYACVKAGDDLSNAKWFDWADADGGCIKIGNLETTTYKVYYKLTDGEEKVSKATTVDLSDKMDTAIVFVSPVTGFKGAVSNNVVSVIGFMPYYNVYGKNEEPYDFNVVVSGDSAQKGISFSNYENSLQFKLDKNYIPKGDDSFEFTYQVIGRDQSVIGEKTCTVSFYRYADEN